MTETRPAIGLVLACALAACGGPNPSNGNPLVHPAGGDAALPAADAGATAPDAGQLDAGTADAGTTAPPAPPPAPVGPRIGDCTVFPPDNAFNADISGMPVDPHSADYLAQMQAGSLHLHPDFGASQYGLPYMTVPGTQPRVPMTFTYSSESDPGPYPFPSNLAIQGGSNGTGDRHAIVVDTGSCQLFETYQTWASGSGYRADSGAVWDLTTGAPRPDGWTGATASGLPLFAGLARPEEVLDDGEIRHALVFTSGTTAHSYVHPATHSSGTSTATYAPPMGLRVRLKASYDLSGFSGPSLVILKALKRYGMMMVDNTPPGMFWSVAGAQSTRWPDAELQILKTVPASAFEVVQLGTIHPGI